MNKVDGQEVRNPLSSWKNFVLLLLIADIVFIIWTGLDLLAVLRLFFILPFLFLYIRRSYFAWHTLAVIILISGFTYMVLQSLNYYPTLKPALINWILPVISITLLYCLLRIRKRYYTFTSQHFSETNLFKLWKLKLKQEQIENYHKFAKNKLKQSGEDILVTLFVSFVVFILAAFLTPYLTKTFGQSAKNTMFIVCGILILMVIAGALKALYSFFISMYYFLAVILANHNSKKSVKMTDNLNLE